MLTLVVKVSFITKWRYYFIVMNNADLSSFIINLVISHNFLYRFCAYFVNFAMKFQFNLKVITPSLQIEKILSLDRQFAPF